MSLLTIALLQMMACGNNQAANQAKGELFCRRAQAMGADIALFPEIKKMRSKGQRQSASV